jgi:hypothetical protein
MPISWDGRFLKSCGECSFYNWNAVTSFKSIELDSCNLLELTGVESDLTPNDEGEIPLFFNNCPLKELVLEEQLSTNPTPMFGFIGILESEKNMNRDDPEYLKIKLDKSKEAICKNIEASIRKNDQWIQRLAEADAQIGGLYCLIDQVKDLLIDDCDGYPKGCEKCTTDYDARILHKHSCLIYQIQEILK